MPERLRSPATYTGRRLGPPLRSACFGTAKESNARYRRLVAQGAVGLSLAFDLPTRLGRDSDAPLARGEVGRAGVAVDSIDDMRVLLHGIPLDRVATSMTINAPAALLLLLYQLVAEERGIPAGRLTGTVHNDVLGEWIARGTCVFPPRPSLRLTADLLVYCKAELPRWRPVPISGRLLAEAGATPAQEIAFTLANGIEYVRTAVAAGLDADDLAPLLEEIARLREALVSDDVEPAALDLMRGVEDLGGALAALELGFQQREIEGAPASRTARHRGTDLGDRVVVADHGVAARQAERLAKLRAWRDQERVDVHISALRKAASGQDNVLYPMKEALAAGATVGEVCDALRETWATYGEEP
ncbi:methylmalonyl-CoA mutase family protein [Streptomyces sp. MMG1121]|uniref:methylmalonyl-CoA mutase family protein n=1 Tax=Streptomyces sp. MMG1121 TaxID=1415544 RepID=UPI0006AFE1EF|nr:methylmalonyl-CoA mutase family protein [Streptomyces sp. MMG1121]